jgi:hypothetical protein
MTKDEALEAIAATVPRSMRDIEKTVLIVVVSILAEIRDLLAGEAKPAENPEKNAKKDD